MIYNRYWHYFRLASCSLLFCLLIPQGIARADATLHQWSEQERTFLRTMWIGSLQPKQDASNRLVDNAQAVELGHKLFFDTRFSANGKVSCASCHVPKKFFTDGLKTGKGIAELSRNTPTVVGSSQQTWFFHDGRADSLWSQALLPLENEKEHGGNRGQYAHIIFNDKALRQRYEALFGAMPDLSNRKRFPSQAGPVKDSAALKNWNGMANGDQRSVTDIFVNMGKVIAAYETTLQPGPSRFDHYVKALLDNQPDVAKQQLSDEEVKGLRIFVSKAKCITCHSGPLLTDMGFHNISVQPPEGKKHDVGRFAGAKEVMKSPFNCRSTYNDAHDNNNKANCDELKYIVMDRHETQGAMKTPSLRNVAKTAPYMHAGQYKTLRDVIKHYIDPPPVKFRLSELFLQVDLNEQELNQLEAFLNSLNSNISTPEAHLAPPK